MSRLLRPGLRNAVTPEPVRHRNGSTPDRAAVRWRQGSVDEPSPPTGRRQETP
jgi:hypothetical protein